MVVCGMSSPRHLLRLNLLTLAQRYAVVSLITLAPDRFENEILRDGRRRGGRSVTYVYYYFNKRRSRRLCTLYIRARNISVTVYRRSETSVIGQPYTSHIIITIVISYYDQLRAVVRRNYNII